MRRITALMLIVIAAACSSHSNKPQAVASPSAQATGASSGVYSFGSISFGASLPAGHEMNLLQRDCEICHGREMWASQRLSLKTWNAELTKMIGFGAPLQKSEVPALANYLAQYLGPNVARIGNAPTATAPPISYTGPPQ